MKGFYTNYGYMGYVSEYKKYMLFASESDYTDYIA